MQVCFTGSAQPVSAVRRSGDKNKTVQRATLRCWQATANAEHFNFVDLQAHGEIVTVEVQFVPPS